MDSVLHRVMAASAIIKSACCFLVIFCSVTGGCAQGYRLGDLTSERPRVRMQAAAHFGERKSLKAAPDLVRMLEDEDAAVRMIAHGALKDLSGKDFGFDPIAPDSAASRKALDQWRAWAAQANKKRRR